MVCELYFDKAIKIYCVLSLNNYSFQPSNDMSYQDEVWICCHPNSYIPCSSQSSVTAPSPHDQESSPGLFFPGKMLFLPRITSGAGFNWGCFFDKKEWANTQRKAEWEGVGQWDKEGGGKRKGRKEETQRGRAQYLLLGHLHPAMLASLKWVSVISF